MDGFAVKTSDVSTVPIKLKVTGSSAAGDIPNQGQAGAWEIMTGAPVPTGYNAVVRIEDVDILSRNDSGLPQEILVKVAAKPKQNIRNAGEDFTVGDLVIPAAEVITPESIMALATVGIDSIKAYPKPTVALISTGRELVDDLSKDLQPGQIRNSNMPYLRAILSENNIKISSQCTIHDEADIFEEKIKEVLANNVNVIISTGAVSMGRYDFIPDSLQKLGAEILFHKVAIRPGKPILFAKFPNGTFYFGLPGNPVSAAVGLRFFTLPLLKKLQGFLAEKPLYAKLSKFEKKKVGLRFFRKAYAYSDTFGQLHVDILTGQESFKIQPMLKANCWAILPENLETLAAAKVIEIAPFSLNTFAIKGEKNENKITALRNFS